MAARLRRELQAEVDMVRGHYGEFKVLVDNDVVIDGGSAAFLGVLPAGAKIVSAVRERVASGADQPGIEEDLRGVRR